MDNKDLEKHMKFKKEPLENSAMELFIVEQVSGHRNLKIGEE